MRDLIVDEAYCIELICTKDIALFCFPIKLFILYFSEFNLNA